MEQSLEEKIKAGEHPIMEPFVMSIYSTLSLDSAEDSQNVNNTIQCAQDYRNNIHPMFTVRTIEDFWRNYQFLLPPDSLDCPNQRYQFHCEGSNLMWEDAFMSKGSRLRYDLEATQCNENISDLWERLLLAVISGELLYEPVATIPNGIQVIKKGEIPFTKMLEESTDNTEKAFKFVAGTQDESGKPRYYRRTPFVGVELTLNPTRKHLTIWMINNDRDYIVSVLQKIVNLPDNVSFTIASNDSQRERPRMQHLRNNNNNNINIKKGRGNM